MTPSRRCPHCDTVLEFALENGRTATFTAHDDAFCATLTRERVRLLNLVLSSQQEAFGRVLADLRRRVDEMLARYNLPSLDEQGRLAEIEMRAALARSLQP